MLSNESRGVGMHVGGTRVAQSTNHTEDVNNDGASSWSPTALGKRMISAVSSYLPISYLGWSRSEGSASGSPVSGEQPASNKISVPVDSDITTGPEDWSVSTSADQVKELHDIAGTSLVEDGSVEHSAPRDSIFKTTDDTISQSDNQADQNIQVYKDNTQTEPSSILNGGVQGPDTGFARHIYPPLYPNTQGSQVTRNRLVHHIFSPLQPSNQRNQSINISPLQQNYSPIHTSEASAIVNGVDHQQMPHLTFSDIKPHMDNVARDLEVLSDVGLNAGLETPIGTLGTSLKQEHVGTVNNMFNLVEQNGHFPEQVAAVKSGELSKGEAVVDTAVAEAISTSKNGYRDYDLARNILQTDLHKTPEETSHKIGFLNKALDFCTKIKEKGVDFISSVMKDQFSEAKRADATFSYWLPDKLRNQTSKSWEEYEAGSTTYFKESRLHKDGLVGKHLKEVEGYGELLKESFRMTAKKRLNFFNYWSSKLTGKEVAPNVTETNLSRPTPSTMQLLQLGIGVFRKHFMLMMEQRRVTKEYSNLAKTGIDMDAKQEQWKRAHEPEALHLISNLTFNSLNASGDRYAAKRDF